MACHVSVTVMTEQVVGDIGDDWKYSINLSVTNDGVTQTPLWSPLSIGEHRIKPNANPAPPPSHPVLPMDAGDCASAAYVNIDVAANEVDVFRNDPGRGTARIPIECPGPSGPRSSLIHKMAIDVSEKPGIFGGQAQLILELKIEAWCQ